MYCGTLWAIFSQTHLPPPFVPHLEIISAEKDRLVVFERYDPPAGTDFINQFRYFMYALFYEKLSDNFWAGIKFHKIDSWGRFYETVVAQN
jgi:hypothetical protein